MITPACFTYFQASRDAFGTKSNRIKFDCVRSCSIGSIIDLTGGCSILFDCQTESNDCCSIAFD